MSRENIIAVTPVEAGVLVSFTLRDGTTRTYLYTGSDAERVLTGEDPKYLNGSLVG